MLRANRVGVLSRVAGDCAALEEKLAAAAAAEDRGAAAAVLGPQIRQIAKSLAATLSSTRAYARATARGVEIVEKLRSDALAGRSTVKQMIMGAGKTTVVAPLLALMLADGKSLVVSVVPKALLEMTRARLRATFATIIAKRVFTLHYDRSTVPSPQLLASLVAARDARAVVVATPTSVKSIMLGYVEALRRARDGAGPAPGLNFPWARRPLDGADAGERWSLPMALVDAVFYASHRRSYAFEARGEVLEALERLRAAVDGGYDRMAFQRLPHLTLLDPAYYHAHVKPPLAAVAFAWLQGSQHLAGISRADALDYLLRRPSSSGSRRPSPRAAALARRFDATAGADGDAAGAVAATCVKLEESLGVAVKRCDDRHEALARCRDLARQKRLRTARARVAPPKGRSGGDDDDDDDAARPGGAAALGLGVASTDATDGVCDWVEARPPWPAPELAPAGDDEPAASKRATSTEVATARLEGLRAIVDGLERRRAAAVDADDAARRALWARAADAHDRLRRAAAPLAAPIARATPPAAARRRAAGPGGRRRLRPRPRRADAGGASTSARAPRWPARRGSSSG
ncbi:hypothetical protein JL721_7203 [Aureococcus anophagefferens]|nr:hypothetical protein JL721_7203 [Aureococcus anophagefferens]